MENDIIRKEGKEWNKRRSEGRKEAGKGSKEKEGGKGKKRDRKRNERMENEPPNIFNFE